MATARERDAETLQQAANRSFQEAVAGQWDNNIYRTAQKEPQKKEANEREM